MTRLGDFARNGIMKTKPYGDSRLITRIELARRLSLHPRTIDRWLAEGRIDALYHPLGPARGRRVYFDWSAVKRELRLS